MLCKHRFTRSPEQLNLVQIYGTFRNYLGISHREQLRYTPM